MEEKAPLVAMLNQPNLSWTVRFWKRAIRLVFGVLVFVGGFAESIWGQSASDRYQLGRRLERFERAWQDASQEGRVASTGAMERAVQSFFSMQLGVAGKSLDRAWLSVLGIPDSQQDEALEVLRWSMEVEERVFRTDGVRVRGRVFSFYPGARKSGSVSPETRRESGKQGADEQQEEESESNGESFEVEMSLIRRGDGREIGRAHV